LFKVLRSLSTSQIIVVKVFCFELEGRPDSPQGSVDPAKIQKGKSWALVHEKFVNEIENGLQAAFSPWK